MHALIPVRNTVQVVLKFMPYLKTGHNHEFNAARRGEVRESRFADRFGSTLDFLPCAAGLHGLTLTAPGQVDNEFASQILPSSV